MLHHTNHGKHESEQQETKIENQNNTRVLTSFLQSVAWLKINTTQMSEASHNKKQTNKNKTKNTTTSRRKFYHPDFILQFVCFDAPIIVKDGVTRGAHYTHERKNALDS